MANLELEQMALEVSEYMRTRHFGKYRGIVQEIGEGENLGKIKAAVPDVYGQGEADGGGTVISPWALPCVPFAGPNHGLVVLPEVDDGVWIEFEAGDPSRPIWTGCWWGDDEIPDPGGPQTRVLVTSGGHQVVLDDQDNRLQLLHSGGAELTMTNNDITLKIGQTQIVLSSSGVNINNGAFEVR
jgi:uncharacterized protein involved in type VI secretion and phage assembly